MYIWDKNVPLHEIKREGKLKDDLTTWIFEGFTPTAKLANGKSYGIITDHIGRPIRSIDDNGELVWSADYDIYGRLKNVKGERTFIPFRQVGQIEDSELEGLYYNRYRWYNSETGCYISQDPIGLAGNNPTLYAFVKNVNTEVDVFGLIIIFRGVNQNHQGYEDAKRGNAKPIGGTASAAEHNEGNTNSPYTSWTTNEEVAKNYALRPNGEGVVLRLDIDESLIVESPNKKVVLLKQGGGIVSEDEVLIQGEVRNAEVSTCGS